MIMFVAITKTKTMKNQAKFTTVALKPNQHLLTTCGFHGISETWMEGFTDGKRDESLDGYYINRSLTEIK